MINKIKRAIIKNISNIPGWSSKRKFVIFLSDDWGSIRVPFDAQKKLERKGIPISKNYFDCFDGLASTDDLNMLYETLRSVKDSQNNPANFTAVSVVANPDFKAIKHNNYKEYVYEPFTHTLERIYPNNKVFDLWEEGINANVFTPQYHGREHFNSDLWLKGLQNGDRILLELFEAEAIGPVTNLYNNLMSNYMAAFDFEEKSLPQKTVNTAIDGLKLFENIFGYKSSLFTSTSLLHNLDLEGKLQPCGIDYIDKAKTNWNVLGGGSYSKSRHKLGELNKFGQYYITRNCLFEPAQPGNNDWVGSCMRDIETSFRWGKPAIISSHRVNYVGCASKENRNKGINDLSLLLRSIIKKWPSVEFKNVAEFAELLKQ